jgi:hypothetical protein
MPFHGIEESAKRRANHLRRNKMDKKSGYYIFGGLLIGALFGLIWAGLVGLGIGALIGTAIGWFLAAYVLEKDKKTKK